MPGKKTPLRNLAVLWCCAATLLVAVSGIGLRVRGESDARGQAAQEKVSIAADFVQSWQEGAETVHVLRGRCRIVNGERVLRAEKAVVWRLIEAQGAPPRERLTAYLEGQVQVETPGRTQTEQTLLLDLNASGVMLQSTYPVLTEPGTHDTTYQQGVRRRTNTRRGTIRQVQYVPTEIDAGQELQSIQLKPPPGTLRRVRIFPRTGGRIAAESFKVEDVTPPEQVFILSGGVNLLVDGIDQQIGGQPIGTIDLSADRIVIWTLADTLNNLGGETIQSQETPLQVYLEGNIVARQGKNVLRASRAFYDAREDRALLLNAELRARIEGFPAKVRVRAEELRQLARDTYQAQRAWITTSEYGKPGYRLQASDIFVEPRYTDDWVRYNGPRIDPQTGEPVGDSTLWATTLNNTFFVEDVPLGYFPYLSVPAEDPNIPLRNINVQNDRIFGTQVRTTWDLFKLLGIERPGGVDWTLQADYLSKRGPEIGTAGTYRGADRFGLQGPYEGGGYLSFIYDHGHDNLGQDRKNLIPKEKTRGGVSVRDRQFLPFGMLLSSELGYVSDRNWLEQYREQEFDTGKDLETFISLSQQLDDWAWSVMVRPRLYNDYNTTEWFPRGDLYLLGEPLLGSWLTWSTHSYAGYANQKIASPPTDPADKYSVLPFEANAQGAVLATRHELDMPFDLGPVHLVPYALGEAAFWGDTATPNSLFAPTSTDLGSLSRLYGSAGVRGSVEMWKVYPNVYSDVLGLNGLAHKMVFDADYSYAQSTQSLSAVVPQFNEFDDNSNEQFRRRLLFNTYGGTVPPQFEPRFFGVRSGVAQNVTAPYNELVDDMHVLRLGWRNRLQTKVGPVNAPRIKNWMTLDLETSFFPNADRDNFGESFGLYGARYNWFVGDRTTITAGALFDSFDNPEKLWNVGIISQRTARGSVYLGLRNIDGGSQLHSRIITASYSYVMSPKWISTMSTSYDLGEHQNRGQSITVTRVGSDFLVHVGFAVDTTKNNVGVGISVEPRFAPFSGGQGFGSSGTQLGSLLSGTGR